MPINNYHNSYFEKKKFILYKNFMCIAQVTISFSNFQGNFIRNFKKKLSILKCVN